MKKLNFLKMAYSIQELITTIVIIGILVILITGFMKHDSQNQFDAKINKTSANISAIIEKDLILKTGKKFQDYNIPEIKTLLGQKLSIKTTCNSEQNSNLCWGNNTLDDEIKSSNLKYLLIDNTSIAFSDEELGKIYIDANGPKSPNKLGKDIQLYRSIYSRPNSRSYNGGETPGGGTPGGGGETPNNGGTTGGGGGGSNPTNTVCNKDGNKPSNSYWNDSSNTCWTCNEGYIAHANLCCQKITDNKKEYSSDSCTLVCKSNYDTVNGECCEKNKDNTKEYKSACTLGCNSSYPYAHGNLCCSTNTSNSVRRKNSTSCDTCSKGTNERWKNDTGCDTCSKPDNADWSSTTGCDWTCKTGYYGSKCTNSCKNYNVDLKPGDSTTIPNSCTGCSMHPGSLNDSGGFKGDYYFNNNKQGSVNGYCKPSKNNDESNCRPFINIPAGTNVKVTGGAHNNASSGKKGLMVIKNCN